MSIIEERLFDTLTTDTDIVALVGNRVYPVIVPEQTEYPCISYQVISGKAISTLSHDLATLKFKRIQINIWAEDYSQVKELEDLVTDAIYTGVVKGHTENYRDLNDSELRLFGSSLDMVANNKIEAGYFVSNQGNFFVSNEGNRFISGA